jgi:hypothetical protein
MKLIRYSEQPELWANSLEITHEVWPEYNQHGDVMNAYWSRLFDEFPDYQFVLYEDEVLGEGHTIPCRWDGTPDAKGPAAARFERGCAAGPAALAFGTD